MRPSNADHTGQPWRIHDLTRDFRLEDVWAFRTPGSGPHDFATMLAAIAAAGGSAGLPLPVRFLFRTRRKLGAILGLDNVHGRTRWPGADPARPPATGPS